MTSASCKPSWVFGIAQEYLLAKGVGFVPFHEHEISENIKYRRRYQFHDAVVKPLMKTASNYGYPYTLTDLSKKISVAICKNVLHHMPSESAVRALIDECIRIADRAVIVEVMDPTFESRWGRIRHRYYLDFLKDAAVHFYSTDEFNAVTDNPALTQRFDMPTIRGVYQFAVFES